MADGLYPHKFPHAIRLREARESLQDGGITPAQIRALMLTAVNAYRGLWVGRKRRYSPDEAPARVWTMYRCSFVGQTYKDLPEEVDLDDPGFQVVAQFVKDALDRLDAYDHDAGVYILPDKSVV